MLPGRVRKEVNKASLPHGKMLPETGGMKMKEISRQEQLEQLRWRYARRGEEGKSQMLDELCQQHGYHRKHAIRLLNALGRPRERRPPPGPERQYLSIDPVVKVIWLAAE